MHCSLCGKCCQETEMELSGEDVKRLEEAGFRREEFTVTGKDGISRIRNVGKWCYFYDADKKRCRVYAERPLGCYLYPVIYSVDDDAIMIDNLCPRDETIPEHELKTKGRILIELLKTIDAEAKTK